MAYAFTIDRGEGPVALPYGPFTDAAGVGHSVQVLDAWSDEELAAIGVIRTEAADPRRLIPKSVVQERVHAIGKLGDAFAALQAQPILFGRWFAPDWPNVYADDDGLLTLLTGIGCTPEEIETVTAP